MKKLLSITICLLALFVSANFGQKQTGTQKKSKMPANRKAKTIKPTEFVCQIGANVVSINLSQTEILADCPASDEVCVNKKIIKVETVAVDSEYVEVKYVYAVSAGKIIGEGANVEWDLSNVVPGSYTITAGISQYDSSFNKWAVYGQTKTRAIVIK